MSAYKELEKIYKRASRLGHASAILGWDEAVNMPDGGSTGRNDALAEISLILHEIMTSDTIKDLVARAANEDLSGWEAANFKHIQKSVLRSAVLPAELVEKSSRATSRCEQAWRKMRENNDWVGFKPLLEEVVKNERETATILSDHFGGSKYENLMDSYEPEMTTKKLDDVFGDLKKFLPNFISAVREKQSSQPTTAFDGPFPIEKQRALGIDMMKAVGFNFDHGRLDISHHPFCGGVPRDVRITTRYDENDWTSSLMGVLHETGHAKYEQGLPDDWLEQPVGSSLGMGIHESQSLLQEMQVCRSSEFLQFARPIINEHLGLGATHEDLVNINTRVKPGYIRVDADEVTYPCHVIIRYEIEKALIEGTIEVNDIPQLWDQKMQEMLGVDTKGNFKDGCMQDVHWPAGLFGYFPSYTLGAMYAAQLFAAAEKQHPNLRDRMVHGDFTTLNEWLKKNVWSKGSLLSTDDLMVHATGETLDASYLKNHLINRYMGGAYDGSTVQENHVIDFHTLQNLRRS